MSNIMRASFAIGAANRPIAHQPEASGRLALYKPGLLVGAATMLVGLAPPLLAQSTTATRATERYSDEIVVTAQRRSENIQSVPIAIQALSADALQERGVRSVQDLGQFTPNVTITTPAGAGSQPNIVIRGIGLNDFNSNNAGPNGVYADEFYISSPNAQGVGIFDLERVEVLKGPQGTLYGRNTSGGAINLVSAKPSDKFTAQAHAEYGSYDTVNAEGAIGGPITSTLTGRLSGIYNYSRGYVHNHLADRSENGTNNFAIRAQLDWQPVDGLSVLLKSQIARVVTRPNQYKMYGTFDPVTGALCSAAEIFADACVNLAGYGGDGKLNDGDYNRNGKFRKTDYLNTVRISYDAGDIRLVSLTGYQFDRHFVPEDTDASPNRLLEVDFGSKSYEFTQEFRASQSKDNYNWVAGVYFLNEVIKQKQPLYLLLDLDDLLGPGGGDGIAVIQNTINRQKSQSFALFGQGEIELIPGLRLVAGARYTWDSKDFDALSFQQFQSGGKDNFGPVQDIDAQSRSAKDKRFNWRLGLNYQFNPEIMAYASVATGYKGSGFNGGILNPDAATRALQLAPVKPESVTAYEVGIKTTLFDRLLTLNASFFYNDYKNQQLLLVAPSPIPNQPSFFALDNAKKARTFGLDADMTLRPTENLTITGQLGLLDSKLINFVATRDVNQPDYSGNRLAFAPATTAAIALDWVLPVGERSITFHADSNYRSRQYFDPSNTDYLSQAGYWIHNARISLQLTDRFEVGAFARNFTNKHYLTNAADLSNPIGVLQGTRGIPRIIGADMNFRF